MHEAINNISHWIKREAQILGFDFCGICRAEFLEKEAFIMEKWLKAGMHGEMVYMQNYFEKRLDPRKLLEGARSVVVLGYNYFPQEKIPEKDNYVLAKYAYGEDYHDIIGKKLVDLTERLYKIAGNIAAKRYVDTAPLMEKALAVKAGLGWIGKNGCLINPKKGSFFFIAEILTDLVLEYDSPSDRNLCGNCTKCKDACPTKAIVAPGIIDARRCISYLTIEYKGAFPVEFLGQFRNCIFGCDICQDVCPWNRFARPHTEKKFMPHQKLVALRKADWESITQDLYREIFKKSAVKRAKYNGLLRNIDFVKT